MDLVNLNQVNSTSLGADDENLLCEFIPLRALGIFCGGNGLCMGFSIWIFDCTGDHLVGNKTIFEAFANTLCISFLAWIVWCVGLFGLLV